MAQILLSSHLMITDPMFVMWNEEKLYPPRIQTILRVGIGHDIFIRCEITSKMPGKKSMRLRRSIALTLLKTLKKLGFLVLNEDLFHFDGSMSGFMRDRTINDDPGAFNLETEAQKLGTWIRFRRLKSGLTQRNLAKQAGISETHLSHIERGQTKIKPGTWGKLRPHLYKTTDQVTPSLGQELDFEEPPPGSPPSLTS